MVGWVGCLSSWSRVDENKENNYFTSGSYMPFFREADKTVNSINNKNQLTTDTHFFL